MAGNVERGLLERFGKWFAYRHLQSMPFFIQVLVTVNLVEPNPKNAILGVIFYIHLFPLETMER